MLAHIYHGVEKEDGGGGRKRGREGAEAFYMNLQYSIIIPFTVPPATFILVNFCLTL